MGTAQTPFLQKCAKALLFAAALAVNAFSQEADVAYVPFFVNADATVTARPPAGAAGVAQASKSVAANTLDTLVIVLGAAASTARGPRGQANAPAAVSYSRGVVSLKLQPRPYENAVVSLYSVNGKRILRGKASALKAEGMSLSRADVAPGVYLLSVKGVNGSSFAARMTHRGGKISVNVAFGGENVLYAAADEGAWTITVEAAGYIGKAYAFSPRKGMNDRQDITLLPLVNINIDMAFVEGGTFTMGCTDSEYDCYDMEKPPHRVAVGSFYIGKYEVTQKLWSEVTGGSPPSGYGSGDNYPVYSVSWDDAQEFINTLNAKTGRKYRLPTEAEWEYAARGGSGGAGNKYSGGSNVDSVAWHWGNSGGGVKPAGGKRANALGIYDMSGNVWEWVNDCYVDYDSTEQVNPAGPLACSDRVYRGGSWSGGAEFCRVSFRNIRAQDAHAFNVGFRLAVDP